VALGVAGIGLPALLAACGDDDNGGTVSAPGGSGTGTSAAQAAEEARAIVGDVTDFALTSDEWPGAFGFVTLRVRKGAFDGNDVYFVRTDTSDEDFASTEELVYVPKLATMTGDGLSGAAYVVEDGARRPARRVLQRAGPRRLHPRLDSAPRRLVGPTAGAALEDGRQRRRGRR